MAMRDDDKLVRQLSLVAFLMAQGRPATAAEIHESVEGYGGMSDQSFLRRFYSDRGELDALGIRLTVHRADDDPFQGDLYTLMTSDYYLGDIDFTDAETSALQTCLYLLEGQFAYAEPLRLALQHLTLGRPSPLDDQAARTVSVNLLGGKYSAEVAGHLSKIETAISRRKTIRFGYYTIGRDERGERLVDPYSLLYLGGNWYLVGYAHEREAIRCFRLSRIEGRIVFKTRAEHDFPAPRDLDLSRYRDRAPWQLADQAGLATMRLTPKVAWWVDRMFGQYGETTLAKDGSGTYETPFAASWDLVSWALGLAPDVIIEGPGDLRDSVLSALNHLHERHVGPSDHLTAQTTKLAPPAEPRKREADVPPPEGVVPAERFSRLLALMTSLLATCGRQRATHVECAQLRDSLNISQEVLEEDLNLLNLINFGGGCYALYAQVDGDRVEVTKERYGDQFARPARLSPLEAKALLWALDFIGDRLPLPTHDALTSVRAKIEAAIGDDPRRTVENGRIATADAEVAAALNRAIREDRPVEIEYWTESRSALTSRAVEPHLLMNARDAWYLIAYCRTAEDRRTFRLDRIRSAKVLDENFARRPEFAAGTGTPWAAGDPGDDAVASSATVWCSPLVARWLLEEHQVRATGADGSALVDIRYVSEAWIVKEILKYQGEAVLVEPAELRATVASAAADLTAAYAAPVKRSKVAARKG